MMTHLRVVGRKQNYVPASVPLDPLLLFIPLSVSVPFFFYAFNTRLSVFLCAGAVLVSSRILTGDFKSAIGFSLDGWLLYTYQLWDRQNDVLSLTSPVCLNSWLRCWLVGEIWRCTRIQTFVCHLCFYSDTLLFVMVQKQHFFPPSPFTPPDLSSAASCLGSWAFFGSVVTSASLLVLGVIRALIVSPVAYLAMGETPICSLWVRGFVCLLPCVLLCTCSGLCARIMCVKTHRGCEEVFCYWMWQMFCLLGFYWPG